MRDRAGVRARLTWRLLLVPRLLLAAGVIIWALLRVVTTRRRPRPARLPPSGDDPVAGALASARPVSRFADERLDPEDLRWIVSVGELDPVDGDGFNTVVGLDDAAASYADLAADGLEDAVSDQPGIDAVEQTDREVILLRSLLALPDVHAAVVRALLAVNGDPRPVPRRRALRPAAMRALADGAATVMGEHGFAGRLRTAPGDDPGFYRFLAEDRLVQVVSLRDGIGQHHDDGTVTDALVRLTVDVVEIATPDVLDAVVSGGGGEVVAGRRILSASFGWTPATAGGVEHVLRREAVPLCRATGSRAAIVERWVGGLPWHVPDLPSWEAAGIAADWGFPGHARDLRRHGQRRPPPPGR
jgi:hypothetical protein